MNKTWLGNLVKTKTKSQQKLHVKLTQRQIGYRVIKVRMLERTQEVDERHAKSVR